jgi:hypothetical protein
VTLHSRLEGPHIRSECGGCNKKSRRPRRENKQVTQVVTLLSCIWEIHNLNLRRGSASSLNALPVSPIEGLCSDGTFKASFPILFCLPCNHFIKFDAKSEYRVLVMNSSASYSRILWFSPWHGGWLSCFVVTMWDLRFSRRWWVDIGLLGFKAVWNCRSTPPFQRNILSWRWRQYTPPKHWYLPTSLHGVTT